MSAVIAFDKTALETTRLRLRPHLSEDATGVFAIFSDEDVIRFWSTGAMTRLEQAEDWLKRTIEGIQIGRALQLALERKDSGELVGTCSLYEFNEQCRRAEVGYALASKHWGNGYMHEALTALLNYAFADLKLHRIEADIHPDNTASANLLERLGFKYEGLLRERWIVDGIVSDSAYYGLLFRDWRCKVEG